MSQALFVAGLFVLGMVVVDGMGGAWISALIRRADRAAVVASIVMALAVAAISLAVGLFTIGKLLLPALDSWSAGRESFFGCLVVAGVAGAFITAMHVARRHRPVKAAQVTAGD